MTKLYIRFCFAWYLYNLQNGYTTK
ncbi:hypothetical protein ACQ27_gp418 [Klebsiella phage K64-1]|nr:hypothetical protein ACQ27_gp418 [Klebsiella phage K64-1]